MENGIFAGERISMKKRHGQAFPLAAVRRQLTCWKRRTFGPRGFQLEGRYYRYSHHHYMYESERIVEVGLVWDFLQGRQGEALEVGNVLSNYHAFSHTVVDKYEVATGVLNEDIVSYDPGKKFDTIVSISTLEHVGWDESPREPEKILLAFDRVRTLLKDNGRMVITMPLGYNSFLDQLVREERTGFDQVLYLKRFNVANEWRQSSLDQIASAEYNNPFPFANAVAVAFQGDAIQH
jgi:hypothetical protein